MKGLIIFAALINPVELTIQDRVDVIHVNNFYSECGKRVFTQNIFTDRGPECLERIAAWRLWKSDDNRPQFNHDTGLWECRWVEGDVIRRVVSPTVRETWTQAGYDGDPELNQRAVWPKERRRELRSIKTK